MSSSVSLHPMCWSAASLAGHHFTHLKDNEVFFLFLQTDLIQPMAAKSVLDPMKIVGGYSQERKDKVRDSIKLHH